jgi:hypothetical protein
MTKPLDAFLCDLLSTHPHDPANAQYLVPLQDPKDEETAQEMAGINYNAYAADYFTDATPPEVADARYRQFLIDARRMVVDEEYMRLMMSIG